MTDAYDDAMNAEYQPRSSTYFGAVQVDVWPAALIKGQGKVTFDPMQHRQDQRVTAIKIAVDAIKRDGTTFVLEREMIAESKEWAQIIKPSLRALNADLRGLNGKYARVETVSTGRTYTNKNGEEKQSTTIKFVAIYQDNGECAAAMDEYFAASNQGEQTANPAPANGNGNNAERETAKKFLAPLWKSCNGDITAFEQKLTKTAPVNKYFNLMSPEVVELVTAQA